MRGTLTLQPIASCEGQNVPEKKVKIVENQANTVRTLIHFSVFVFLFIFSKTLDRSAKQSMSQVTLHRNTKM